MPGLCLSSCSAFSLHLGFSFLLPDAKKTTHRYYPKRNHCEHCTLQCLEIRIRHTETLKEKLVISLKTDLPSLLERYQALHGLPVPETHPVATRAADSKGNISTCWFGGVRTGSVQSVAGLMPAQLVLKASPAQRLQWTECSGQTFCVCNGKKHLQDHNHFT